MAAKRTWVNAGATTVTIDGIATRYETAGTGPPLLMYAPGGFNATVEAWSTLGIYAKIVDPITKEPYSRDPRYIAQKSVEYLKSTGIGDTCFIGPEPEFFIFDQVRYEHTQQRGFYEIDSVEAAFRDDFTAAAKTFIGLVLKQAMSPMDPATLSPCRARKA